MFEVRESIDFMFTTFQRGFLLLYFFGFPVLTFQLPKSNIQTKKRTGNENHFKMRDPGNEIE